ncbi:MAG: hypothetical protein JWP35_918 [Caulobacter sp.]|nr:hypothetical protein [Caulobacter sp.]
MSPAPISERRFPFGLTIAVALAFALAVGLGVWQVKRLAWKQGLLAHIEALKTAAPQALGPVLARAARGEDVNLTRVSVDCLAGDFPAAHVYLGSIDSTGAAGWRPISPCRIDTGGFNLIGIDRGFAASGGDVNPPKSIPPAPRHVVGVLRLAEGPSGAQKFGDLAQNDAIGYQFRDGAVQALMRDTGGKAPRYVVVAEHEDPAPPGITPSGLSTRIANNHLSYALTWFGLAGALLAVYAAMLFRRFKPA